MTLCVRPVFGIVTVAVLDTYRDEISDGYPIWDRIYYGRHHILGWHTYQVTFNSGTVTRPNEIVFMHTTHKITGRTAHSVDHTWNSWAYSTQLITCKIPGCTAIMQPSHALCTWRVPRYGVTFVHVLTYLTNPHALSKKAMAEEDVVSKLEYSPVKKIRESEALLVRQCSSHLGEYGLTLWVASILMYAQELPNFFLCLLCCMSATWSKYKYNLPANICTSVCPRISNILINNTNCIPMISSASTHTTTMMYCSTFLRTA